jgi:hypothetical protein
MSGPFEQFTDYDFRHWVAVQAEDGAAQSVHRLFALQTNDQRNTWFDIRNRRNELAGYLADLDVALKLTDWKTRNSRTNHESLPLKCRYALFAAAVLDLSRNQLPELTAHYVRAGVWTRDQALSWARLNPNRQAAVEAVRDVLRQDAGRGGDEIARMALSAGASITDADNKVLAIASLAQDLPPHLLGQALELVEAEANEGSRVGGLQALLPHLPKKLHREALAVAKRFKSERLKAEALAVVAASLDEPERTDAFRLSLQVARDAITRDGDGGSLGITRHLPQEWLRAFYEMIDEETYPDTRESVLVSYLESLADENPDAVRERINRVQSWHHQTLATRVAVAFAKAGRYEDAAATAFSLQAGDSDVIGTIFEILKHAPESEWLRWIELLGVPDQTYFVIQLRGLANSPEVPPSLLRKLAAAATDERVRLEARAIIARALTDAEVEDLVDTCLETDSSFSWKLFTDLSPYLSIEQVRRVLDHMAEPDIFSIDPYKTLLGRLAQLGQSNEAFERVNALYDILDSSRAEVLAFLAGHLPPGDLHRVMKAIRPQSVSVERIMARTLLLRWLPEQKAVEIFSEACGIQEALDRLRTLTEMAVDFPTNEIDHLAQALLNALEESFSSPSRDRDQLLIEGFRALSVVLKRRPLFFFAERAVEAACDRTWSSETKLVLLMELVAAGSGVCNITQILAKALEIAGQNSALLSIVSQGLSKAHSEALGKLLGEQKEPERLVNLLKAAAAFLSPVALGEAYELVCTIENAQTRLSGLNALIRHLPKRRRKVAAAAELARKSEWIRDWDAAVFAAHIFAADAAELVRSEVKNIDLMFACADAWMKILCADSISLVTGSREPIGKALEAVDEIEGGARCDAIQSLAPRLDAEQIRDALGLLSRIQNEDLVPALAALIERAAALQDSWLIHDCLGAVENSFTRSELIEEVAPSLPIDVVYQLRGDAKHNSDCQAALAVRAAELGDLYLMFSLLDEKGRSFASDERTYELVYRSAPISDLEALVKYTEKVWPFQRVEALLQLVGRVHVSRRRGLVNTILDSIQSENMRGRVETFRALEPELNRMPASEIFSRFGESMRIRAQAGREEVLVDLRAFAPTLVSHFGREVAVKLDDAICLGAQDVW